MAKNSLLDYKYRSHSTKVKVIFAMTTAKNDLTEYITHTFFAFMHNKAQMCNTNMTFSPELTEVN